ENFQAPLESVAVKSFAAARVVVRAVGVKPISCGVNVKVNYFREAWTFDQELLFGNQASDELGFGLIQMESLAVCRAIHSRIREKHLGCTRFNNHRVQSGGLEIAARLGGQDQGGVLLPPRL